MHCALQIGLKAPSSTNCELLFPPYRACTIALYYSRLKLLFINFFLDWHKPAFDHILVKIHFFARERREMNIVIDMSVHIFKGANTGINSHF